MNKRAAALVAVIGVTSAACQGASVSPLSESERMTIVEGVRATLADYVVAVNSGELRRITRFYADDPEFHWVENGAVAYESYAAVEQAFGALQSSVSELKLELGEPRIVPLARGAAAVTVSYSQVFADSSGGRFETDGHITLVAVERVDGWKFMLGHASQPQPRP
jgi:ketosteroid isomerase-like protein